MSQNLAQLCALLLHDTYGALYSHIFSTLTRHGRLSAREISQKSHLLHRQVLQALTILTQHMLVFHHTHTNGRTSYQANPSGVLNILRVGKSTELMEQKFGHDGARILTHLLAHGHDTVKNLQELLAGVEATTHQNGVKLESGQRAYVEELHPERPKAIHRLLRRLLEEDYVVELRPAHFQTLSDTQRSAEDAVKAGGSLSSAKGKKAKEEFDEAVRVEIVTRLCGESLSTEVATGSKRVAPDDLETSVFKKQKLVNGGSNVAAASAEQLAAQRSTRLDYHTVLRLNHRKLLLLHRHQMMVELVQQRMGPQTAHILAALLRQCDRLPQKIVESGHLLFSETTSTEDYAVRIDMDQLLNDINTKDQRHSGLVNGKVNGFVNSIHEKPLDYDELAEQVAALSDGYCTFIVRKPDHEDWYVDLIDAENRLRDNEIMQMVKRRFGPMSFRVLRILISRGKVDEKALQEIGLVNAKDLRRCLAQLNMHGFIDLQEVPREPQRQPARTIYLWFYDAERVRKRVLENVYKSMCRLLQRLKIEKEKVESTLQKIERSDVKGKEHEILRSDEIAVLKQWRRKELWYLSQLERLSSSVDILSEN